MKRVVRICSILILLACPGLTSNSVEKKVWAKTSCAYPSGQASHLASGGDASGYWIRVDDPEAIRKLDWVAPLQPYLKLDQLPPNQVIFSVVEPLASEVGATVFYVDGYETRRPIALNGVWRGEDPLACLRSFAPAAGLDVNVPIPGLWLVGPPDALERVALLVVSYSTDPSLQPLQEGQARTALEHAVLAKLPIRAFAGPTVIGLGIYNIPGEPGSFVVVVSQGAFTSFTLGEEVLTVKAFKVRVPPGGRPEDVECVWSSHVGGPLVARVQEDFDGDGLQDYFFLATGPDMPDVILSGADGSTIAAVVADTVAVEKRASGPKLFAVDSLWLQPDGKSELCRYAPESKKLERVALPIDAEAASTGSEAQPPQRDLGPAARLVAALGGPQAVRIYQRPGSQVPTVPGAEFIRTSTSPVWNWFQNRRPAEALEDIRTDLPMTVLYRHITPTYLEERKRAKDAPPDVP